MATNQDRLTQDLVFDILSSARRRYLLYYLREADEPVHINELAEQVAAWENETDVEDLSSQQRKRVYVSLYQSHIPKLESAGIVDYDEESGLVSLTSRANRIDRFLDGGSSEIPWQQFYIALAGVSLALVALVWLEVGIFGQIPATVVGLVVSVGFVISATAHYLYRRARRAEVPSELEERRL